MQAEKTYPYKGVDGACSHSTKRNVVQPMWLTFTYAVPPCMQDCKHQNETLLKQVLRQVGPLSICVSASAWQSYEFGVLEEDCPSDYTLLNHCTQLTGWTTDARGIAWLSRNSWGSSWGESGYIRLRYGKNLCGVADDATIATIAPY